VTWETIAVETKFSNPHLRVVVERVRTPAREREWTTVHRKNAVVIAAITAKSKIVLINQERISIRAAIWEMPAGQIDDSTDRDGKNAREVALRELREETGYELAPGGELIVLGDFFSSPGFTDEKEFLFAARPVRLSATGHAQEESETIHDCREFSVAEINRMIADNTIRDANTLSTWARLLARKIIALPQT
jgi:8-oxo-dGTP pyrophosphatase MutT (NUDIX family)